MTSTATPHLRAGGFAYQADDDWAKLPEGWTMREVADVAVDAADNLYVFNRGDHPVIVLDKHGNFLRSWGDGFFGARAHGIAAGADGFIYCVENTQHAITRFTPEGKLVWTLGESGKPAPKWSNKPFNLPTNMEVSPKTGDIFVADGYGNAAIHRFSPDGKLLASWGAPGCDPGEFQIPHNVVVDQDENVYITDRENYRLQVFDCNGNLKAIWQNIYRPQALCIDREGIVYVGEQLMQRDLFDYPKVGHRLNVYNKKGERLARIGDPDIGDGPNQFIAPHGFAVDSQGNLYVGEVSFTVYGRRFDPPRIFRCFRKLRRV